MQPGENLDKVSMRSPLSSPDLVMHSHFKSEIVKNSSGHWHYLERDDWMNFQGGGGSFPVQNIMLQIFAVHLSRIS